MSKIISYKCSILKGTKRIISASHVDWSKIRPASYLKIKGNPITFDIQKIRENIFLFDFEVIHPKKIQLKSPFGEYFINDDLLEIYFIQYELAGLISIIDGGSHYKENDIVYVEGGSVSIDKNLNKENYTSFRVLSVDENGKILMLGLESKGLYNIPPSQTSNLIQGNGKNAVISLRYIEKENKSFLEQNIKIVERVKLENKYNVYLHLEYPLPSGLKTGSISTRKWEILLSQEYTEEDLFNVDCEIINDFTPNFRLPILLQNSLSKETVVNKSFTIIDYELALLKDRIQKLEEKLSSIS